MEVYISEKFLLILLTTLKKDINQNQDVDLKNLSEYLANFEVDKIDYHKINEQTNFKLQLH